MATPNKNTCTDFMVKLFLEANFEEELFKPPTGSMHFFQSKEIDNTDRKWFQFWKPKMVPNPNYKSSETIKFDIVRGNYET